MIKGYFENLFQSNGMQDDEILSTVRWKVMDEQNVSLILPFMMAEIVGAVKSMHPDKSPGPDGFNPCFSQMYWDEVSLM